MTPCSLNFTWYNPDNGQGIISKEYISKGNDQIKNIKISKNWERSVQQITKKDDSTDKTKPEEVAHSLKFKMNKFWRDKYGNLTLLNCIMMDV